MTASFQKIVMPMRFVTSCAYYYIMLFRNKPFLDEMKASFVDIFRLDASQASEIFINASSLFAGPACEFFFNHDGFCLPGSEMGWECGAEIGNNWCRSCSGDVHGPAVRPYKKGGI